MLYLVHLVQYVGLTNGSKINNANSDSCPPCASGLSNAQGQGIESVQTTADGRVFGKPFTFNEVERHIQEAKRGYDEWLK